MSMCGEIESVKAELYIKNLEYSKCKSWKSSIENKIQELEERLALLAGDRHYIRPMTDEERQRSKEREAINNVHRRV